MSFKLKKAAAVLAVAGTLLLSGCGGKMPFAQKTPNFNSTYTVTADITFDKLKAKADLTRVSPDEWEFRFTEPKQLNGLSIKLNSEKYAASLGGLSFSAEDSSVYAAAPQLIAKAVGLLSNALGDKITSSDGVLTFTDELDGKRITITANERTGDLISLKYPHCKLSVNFSDQKPYTLVIPEDGSVTISE